MPSIRSMPRTGATGHELTNIERHDATRAEVCVAACADAWAADGEIMASPMGLIPTIGARLARLTSNPDLVLSDGEALLLGDVPAVGQPPAVVEGWIPFRSVFDIVANGRAARHDGRDPDRSVRQPEHLRHR